LNRIINVSNKLIQYDEILQPFLKLIPLQTEFFDLSLDRFEQSKVCLISMKNNVVTGMAGLLPRKGFMCVYIVVEKNYQRRGIARELSTALIRESKNKFHILIAMIAIGNDASLKLHQNLGYELVGDRDDLYYTILPLDLIGTIMKYFIRLLFPVIKYCDRYRK
jgi:RimJ/RimL family protein N-acetyltransferase